MTLTENPQFDSGPIKEMRGTTGTVRWALIDFSITITSLISDSDGFVIDTAYKKVSLFSENIKVLWSILSTTYSQMIQKSIQRNKMNEDEKIKCYNWGCM